jgi:hypothetical protein
MSTNTLTSASDITAQFPIKPSAMPKIATDIEKPTFTSLTKFQEAINEQAIAIPAPTGDTALGHLHLVITPTDYAAASITGTAYPIPTNPGETPTHEPGATGLQITENNRIHNIRVANYRLYINTDIQLRNFVLNALPDTYINALCNPVTKYARVTTLQLLTHLWTTYGTISSHDLSINYNKMTTQWNPPTPIESLFRQLREGQQFAKKEEKKYLTGN